jgi:ubiquinone/menaquinone biosynthesis C-methylase UbiE
VSDILDLSEFYKDKSFVKITEKKLPFKDKEFDFVIASHVIEHIEDVSYFLNELSRIGKRGYIEVPSRLEDNLVFENKKDHLWHMDFDDVSFELVISKKIQYFEPILTVSSIKKFDEIFRKSLIIELFWENKIDHRFENIDEKAYNKISLFQLLRKYFSKKIRMFFK